MRLILLTLGLCLFAPSAEAAHVYSFRHVAAHAHHHRHAGAGVAARRIGSSEHRAGDPLGPRPHAWCGWYMRKVLGVADAAFNLARNWARWGHAASPGPGVVVVWPHHVGMITGRSSGGQWIVKSGNDGHAVRERPRSVAGAIAFRRG